jgi:DNA-binding Lrp family transcriptional regulator
MGDDIYVELAEFLDRLPGGLPKTESGAELKILRKLFLPEEAEMAMQLRLFPEPPSIIAERVGMEESEAAEMLESMARKGLILRTRGGGNRAFYQALQFVVGIYEFHLNSIDRELSELMEELIPYMDDRSFKQFRVVPVHSAVDATPSVASYDRIRDLVGKYDLIAVAPCICRLEQGLMGSECERPHETCLTFGIGAQLYIENRDKQERSPGYTGPGGGGRPGTSTRQRQGRREHMLLLQLLLRHSAQLENAGSSR